MHAANVDRGQVRIGAGEGLALVLAAMKEHGGHAGVQEMACGLLLHLAVLAENKVRIFPSCVCYAWILLLRTIYVYNLNLLLSYSIHFAFHRTFVVLVTTLWT